MQKCFITHTVHFTITYAHIPIQASTAAHPFFRSVEIDGSYYTDEFESFRTLSP